MQASCLDYFMEYNETVRRNALRTSNINKDHKEAKLVLVRLKCL